MGVGGGGGDDGWQGDGDNDAGQAGTQKASLIILGVGRVLAGDAAEGYRGRCHRFRLTSRNARRGGMRTSR
eukprot:2516344-Pyramimonas_sp.AAC.1